MKLEYKYGQCYWVGLKSGDIIPTSANDFVVLKENDIENGMLKNNITISNSINEFSINKNIKD